MSTSGQNADTGAGDNVVLSRKTARVALPSAQNAIEPEPEISDNELEEGHIEDDGEDGSDFLADFPDDTEELDLVHSRLKDLDSLRLERFAGHLKKLCLRTNYISELDPKIFHTLAKLEELDLYDNRITNGKKHKKGEDETDGIKDALDNMSELSVLDLSYNNLREVPKALDHLKSLTTVYFVQNKIPEISGLGSVGATLRSLELGSNKIREIKNLDALVNLEELWLGKNKIEKLQNLSSLKRLKILALQSNRITKIEGLEELESLEDLYLSHNGVSRMEGLEHNSKLKTLDLGHNVVPEIENISHLISLVELWLNQNKIPTLHSLEPQLGLISSLETIYLEGNPCQKADVNYRRKIMLALPQLKQIDATFVKLS